jgi:hypothetical protein
VNRLASMQGAFLLHLQGEADLPAGRLLGRVEHLQTGHCIRFATLEQLLSFLSGEMAAPPADESGEPIGETR